MEKQPYLVLRIPDAGEQPFDPLKAFGRGQDAGTIIKVNDNSIILIMARNYINIGITIEIGAGYCMNPIDTGIVCGCAECSITVIE